jgi:hypothetical protein
MSGTNYAPTFTLEVTFGFKTSVPVELISVDFKLILILKTRSDTDTISKRSTFIMAKGQYKNFMK